MDADFWHHKWQHNEIGFHQAAINPFLIAHFGRLQLAPGSRVFLPLCGKTRDISWLLAQGYRVAGAELSALAIEQLFAELGLTPQIQPAGPLTHYHTPGLDVFVGDIFALSAEQLGPVDAVYDRAALVALPPDVRVRYAAHLRDITATAPQLLLCYEYDQALLAGPPFSVSAEEVQQHYATAYEVRCLESHAVAGGFRGAVAARESVWLLR
ncbi:MAG: thiopurine S-methyltransferase [Candidatus Sericytochromatia bacterium]